ncbi:MAG: hypothetical protein C0627_03880 [Sulfurimonas sp.]|nr:MAG: hypothetical protein C0627_03880 [Sulfurimonas sp.]
MVAYNYQEPTKQFTQELRFNGSENLALKNGFKVVLDANAYNGRYFIKDNKKWIHNIAALRRQLCIYDDNVVEEMGYDVATYYKTH